MPTYEFRCEQCEAVTALTTSIAARPTEVPCEQCGGVARRIVSRTSVKLSEASKVARLDPKYDKMVDRAMQNTQNADPDRLLKKMKPFPQSDT